MYFSPMEGELKDICKKSSDKEDRTQAQVHSVKEDGLIDAAQRDYGDWLAPSILSPHPFCPPDTGNSVCSCPEMSTRLFGVDAIGILLASTSVQTCPPLA
jgi:hypothetical protein